LVVYLHLNSHRLLFPELGKLLGPSSPAELHIAIGHIPFRTIHEPLEATFIFRVVKVLVGTTGIQPGTAKIAKMSIALRAGHVVA
jgi:hypothetical protein